MTKPIHPGCTWLACSAAAKHPNRAKTGEIWANLCDRHQQALDESIADDTSPRKMLSAWVKAQGGASIAAKRVLKVPQSRLRDYE